METKTSPTEENASATTQTAQENKVVEVRRGSVVTKIYYTPNRGRHAWTVAWVDDERGRRRALCKTLKAARQRAVAEADRIQKGEAHALALTGTQRLSYVRAMEMVEPLGLTLDMAVQELVQAKKILGPVSIIEAARSYERKHKTTLKPIKVPALVAAFLDSLANAKKSKSVRYQQDMQYRLGRFGKAFHCDLSSITGEKLSAFFENMDLGYRSDINFRRALNTLFNFAKKRNHLSPDWNELDAVEVEAEVDQGKIGIITPAQLARLFGTAKPHVIPIIALGAFAGLRSNEIERLDWSKIHLKGDEKERFIELGEETTKTKSRRLAPVPDALVQWLLPHSRKSGPVWPLSHGHYYVTMLRTARRAKVKMPHNALRHSFVSCRLAMLEDVNKVALEAGHTPLILFRYYRALVPKTTATRWFNVTPAPTANVLPMPQAMIASNAIYRKTP